MRAPVSAAEAPFVRVGNVLLACVRPTGTPFAARRMPASSLRRTLASAAVPGVMVLRRALVRLARRAVSGRHQFAAVRRCASLMPPMPAVANATEATLGRSVVLSDSCPSFHRITATLPLLGTCRTSEVTVQKLLRLQCHEAFCMISLRTLEYFTLFFIKDSVQLVFRDQSSNILKHGGRWTLVSIMASFLLP